MVPSAVEYSLLELLAQTCVVGGVGAAVVGGLGDHVGKVDALAEHVAGHRGLRGRYPQALHIEHAKIKIKICQMVTSFLLLWP